MTRPDPVCFSGGAIDRAAHLRKSADGLRADPAARALTLSRSGDPLVAGGAVIWGAVPADGPALFLGLEGGAPRFAIESDTEDGINLREFIRTGASLNDAAAVGAARALLSWHRSHAFCARCGAASNWSDGGWRRDCPSCGAQHFPRTDPVVIMAVTDGERLALGRQAAMPEGLFTVIAGFMEPGETIEEAVAREAAEELGLTVTSVRYVESQPWPFPSSLMIGCIAQCEPGEIRRDDEELSEAMWMTRPQVADLIAGRIPGRIAPWPQAVARRLMEAWLSGGS